MFKSVIFGFVYVDRGGFLALVSLTIQNTAPIATP